MNESQQTPSPAAYDDEIDLRELVRVLWAGKWLIGAITLAATVIAVVFALMLPNIYRAEALLAPNDQGSAGGLSALAAQYGGLASLAGIDIDSGIDKTALGLETLKSRKFVSEFIEGRDILVPLIAANGWDSQTGVLEIDVSLYDTESRKWTRKARPPRNAKPSMQEAYRAFSKILSVEQDKKTGFVTVFIEHYSPVLAKQWVDWLIEDLNLAIMRRDVAEAEQTIEYLNEQIAETSLAELQSIFFNLIEEQTKTVILAKVTDEYLFRTIDPAVVPEKRSRPKRRLLVLAGLMLGGALGIVIVGLLNIVRK